MKYSFKSLFNIISVSLIAMMLFLVSWIVGSAITGSWDIGEWNKDNNTAYSIVSEDNCNQYYIVISTEVEKYQSN